MSEISINVRQSKIYVILCCVCGVLGASVHLVICGIFINLLVFGNETSENIIGLSISLSYCLGISILVFSITGYVIYLYKKQIDIYTVDKIIRKRGNKVIFELPYENIVTIREGFESVFMVLKTHIIEANGKKGTRNFYAHYSRADISRIKRMITDKYYNIPFN